MSTESSQETGPQGAWKWVTPAIVLALTIYLVQITARLAQDEALLTQTAAIVKERTSAFEVLIKMESRIAVLETADERERSVNEGYPVFVQKMEGAHMAFNDRIARLSAIVDRLEAQLEELIDRVNAVHGPSTNGRPSNFRDMRPHYPTPEQ